MRNRLIKKTVKVGLLPFLFFLWACGNPAETGVDRKVEPARVREVKVASVKAFPPRGYVECVGVLTAHRNVRVASEIGGTIESLLFERGDRVREGQLLAEVGTSSIALEVQQAEAALSAAKSHLEKTETGSRPEEISMAEAGVKEAEASLFEAQRNFKRMNELHGLRAVSQSQFDSAKRNVDTAKAKLEAARHQLALARQGPRIEDKEAARASFKQAEASLALAKDRLKKSRVQAPSPGIIAFREVEGGEVISPGTILTQIVDLTQLKIKTSMSEKDIAVLENQRQFHFIADALPGETFTCRLVFLSPTADPVTRSFPVELSVEKPDQRMADGMTARVRFPLVNEKKTLKVPSAWLAEEEGDLGLFVAEEGKVLFRKVTLGAYYDQRVEILSGLGDEELVVTNPAGLRSGDSVKY